MADSDDLVELSAEQLAVAEQLHLAYEDGYRAGVAAERERRNAQRRRRRGSSRRVPPLVGGARDDG